MLWRETGTGGREPTTVIGQVGEARRLVEWIRRANIEIQLEHSDWGFLWTTATVPTVVDQSTYSRPVDLREYDEETFRLDGDPIEAIDYLDVKGEYYNAESGKPYRAVLMPNGTIRLDDTPNAVHSLTYDYFVQPVDLPTQDAAESVIPATYREAVVARALLLYANYESAPELMPQAQLMYQSYMQSLEAAWLPADRKAHKQAEGNKLGIVVE